jgi:hypothetical protein
MGKHAIRFHINRRSQHYIKVIQTLIHNICENLKKSVECIGLSVTICTCIYEVSRLEHQLRGFLSPCKQIQYLP